MKSEWIKLKRTGLRWMILLFVVYTVFAVWYSSHFIRADNAKLKMYEIFFFQISLLLSAIIGVYMGIVCANEKKANNFQNMLFCTAGKVRAFLSKIILFELNLLISLFASAFIFIVSVNTLFHLDVSYLRFFIYVLSMFCGSLILSTIYAAIAFKYSLGTVICVGCFGTLISAILGVTAIGAKFWSIVPVTYSAMFSHILFTNSVINLGLMYNIIVSIAVSVVGVVCLLLWASKWEGHS